ncbi:MAG: hypothetical protein ACFUZC_01825 [Chthoniobacteraceae bacterium]
MDRKLTEPALLLAPAACCWTIARSEDGGEPQIQEAPSFDEAVKTALQASAETPSSVAIALPARLGVFERFSFPATDSTELESMVQLQFEKLLPYPAEETAIALHTLGQTDSETTVMACAARIETLETFCAPLLKHRIPKRITFQGLHIAALAPANAMACGIWREETDFVFAIFENRRLAYVENLGPSADISSDLPRALLRAEATAGHSPFSEALTDTEGLQETLKTILKIPARLIHPPAIPADEAFDITPRQWRDKATARERRKKLRRQIAGAAVIYAAALLLILVGVAWKSNQLDALRKQTAILQPRVDALIDRQARWKTLEPAVNPQQYLVELLFQTFQSLPTPETRITRFEAARDQLIVEGEAPDAQKAIAFTEKLKARSELADFRFEASPPILQPNEHAQFRIFGKR